MADTMCTWVSCSSSSHLCFFSPWVDLSPSVVRLCSPKSPQFYQVSSLCRLIFYAEVVHFLSERYGALWPWPCLTFWPQPVRQFYVIRAIVASICDFLEFCIVKLGAGTTAFHINLTRQLTTNYTVHLHSLGGSTVLMPPWLTHRQYTQTAFDRLYY